MSFWRRYLEQLRSLFVGARMEAAELLAGVTFVVIVIAAVVLGVAVVAAVVARLRAGT